MTTSGGSTNSCLVVLSSSGTNPLGAVRLTDPRAVRVEYDKSLHGNVIHLSGDPTTTKLQIPREDRPVYALQLTHPYIAVQVFIPTCSSNLIEFVLGDGPTNRLRLCFGTFYYKAEACNKQGTHVRVPLALPRNVWSIILFDVEKLAKYYLKVATFRSVDAIVLGGEMRLRKIISLKDPLPDQYTPWNGILPRDVELPPGTAYTVVAFSPPTVKAAEPIPPPMSLLPPPSNAPNPTKAKPPVASATSALFRLLPGDNQGVGGAGPNDLVAIGTLVQTGQGATPLLSFARKDGQVVVSSVAKVDLSGAGPQPPPPSAPYLCSNQQETVNPSRFIMNTQDDTYVRILADEAPPGAGMGGGQRKPSSIRRKGPAKNSQAMPGEGCLMDPSDWHEDEHPSGWDDLGPVQSTTHQTTTSARVNKLGVTLPPEGGKGLGTGLAGEIPADNYSPRAPVDRLTGWLPYEPIVHTDSDDDEEE